MKADAMAIARRLGVCSWSLQPASPGDLADKLSRVGASCCQLHLDPIREGRWGLDATARALRQAGVEVRSGMMALLGEDYSTLESIRATGGVRPDQHWPENLELAEADAAIASELGLPLVSFHAGFLPDDSGDPERAKMLVRLRAIIGVYRERGIAVAFETGQESAETLAGVLAELDRPIAGVNFDPANLVLYGMGDPVAALRRLAPRVRQVHVKDARRSRVPGAWGDEVPVGSGEVDWHAFFEALDEAGLEVDLMIEREAGGDRLRDIAAAREFVSRHTALRNER
jgi:sugar phosphate isomerase/epimerase